jgi:hypothetical protein
MTIGQILLANNYWDEPYPSVELSEVSISFWSDGKVPTSSSSWGRIKSLYRRSQE